MIGFIRKFSHGAGTAVAYITVGVLGMIWSGVWYYALRDQAVPAESAKYYVCAGCFLSGLAITIIGLLIGRIGQEAQRADLIEASANPPAAVPANGAAVPTQTAIIATTPPAVPVAGGVRRD